MPNKVINHKNLDSIITSFPDINVNDDNDNMFGMISKNSNQNDFTVHDIIFRNKYTNKVIQENYKDLSGETNNDLKSR